MTLYQPKEAETRGFGVRVFYCIQQSICDIEDTVLHAICLHHMVHSNRVKCENKYDIKNDKMYFYFKRTFIKDNKN